MSHPSTDAMLGMPGPLTAMLVALMVLAVLGVATARRGYRRAVVRARVAAHTARVAARVAATATGITIAQWALLAASTSPWVWGAALAAPAVVAGSAVHPFFTVTTVTQTRLTGRGRR